MAVAYFTIPETGKIIYNGDTVILSEYPDIIAVVAYGWYKYEENAMNGWHFILLPAKTVVPAAQVNLSLLTVVPNSSDDDRNPVPLSPELRDIESRAFITLDSIAQRDKLITEFMPNGRIVRVNDSANHTSNYYEWNVETQSWDDWNIGSTIKLSDLEEDAEHRLVTDEEKETWDNKPDGDDVLFHLAALESTDINYSVPDTSSIENNQFFIVYYTYLNRKMLYYKTNTGDVVSAGTFDDLKSVRDVAENIRNSAIRWMNTSSDINYSNPIDLGDIGDTHSFNAGSSPFSTEVSHTLGYHNVPSYVTSGLVFYNHELNQLWMVTNVRRYSAMGTPRCEITTIPIPVIRTDAVQKKIQREEATIYADDWSENMAVVNSISGITSETKLIIQPRYGHSQYMYNKCGIYQADQLDDYIEFHCDTQPQDNILLDIYIL